MHPTVRMHSTLTAATALAVLAALVVLAVVLVAAHGNALAQAKRAYPTVGHLQVSAQRVVRA